MKNSEDLNGEVWVKHPIGIMVSNMGRVWTRNNGKWYGSKNRAYLQVVWKGKVYQVHRLICECFKENTDNLPTVDHIDRNPLNNRIENLRWADYSTQMKNREVDYKAIGEKNSIPILQLNKNLEVIKEWASAREAEMEGGYYHSHITSCCKGRLKSHKGYIWRYKNGEAC